MAFKKARQYDEDQTKKVRKQAAEQNSTGDTTPRAKIQQGLNVYMWLPSMDQREEYYNPEPVRFTGIHYGPFHVCSRNDAVMDESMKELVEDRSFKGCPRCMTAWNTYQDHGGSELAQNHPATEKRRSDLGQMRGVIQVVELSSFFTLDVTGTEIELIADADKYWDDFLETINTGVIPSGSKMPKGMQESALAGSSLLVLNTDTAKGLAYLHYKRSIRLGKTENKSKKPKSPLMEPERFLLTIIRGEDSSATFVGRNGKSQRKGTYDLDITEIQDAEWEAMCSSLLDTFDNKEGFEWIDIYNPTVEIPEDTSKEDEIRLVASSFIKLSDEELEFLLEIENHSFDYRDDIKKQKESFDDDSEEPVRQRNAKKGKSRDEDDDEEDDDEEPATFNKFKRPKARSVVEDDDEEEEEAPPAKKAKPLKATKAKPVVEDDDDDEEEEEAPPAKKAKPTKAKPAPKAKAKPVVEDDDDDDDYYESLDDDDDDDDDD